MQETETNLGVETRDVEAEAEAGSGNGRIGTFSMEAEATVLKCNRFRLYSD